MVLNWWVIQGPPSPFITLLCWSPLVVQWVQKKTQLRSTALNYITAKLSELHFTFTYKLELKGIVQPKMKML